MLIPIITVVDKFILRVESKIYINEGVQNYIVWNMKEVCHKSLHWLCLLLLLKKKQSIKCYNLSSLLIKFVCQLSYYKFIIVYVKLKYTRLSTAGQK